MKILVTGGQLYWLAVNERKKERELRKDQNNAL